jgi:hypothetical protein|tara:strand:- start:169 stop:441 length:273 start_codon:yes stop_codon:yes gene_type:complete
MDKKFLVIEQHKFNTFKDSWTIKFANVDEDTAFNKLVALETLNEDKDKIYFIVNMRYLWTKDIGEDSARSDEPLVLTDEVKESKQGELPL